jgi:AraC-like DNA-binding protein
MIFSGDPIPLPELMRDTFWGSFERNKDFKLLLLRYCKAGLIICGIMGIAVTIGFTLAKLHINEYNTALFYSPEHYKGVIVLFDKIILLLFSSIIIATAKMNLQLRSYRMLAYLIVLICSVAILIDDILNSDITFSSGYLTLILLMATICIPFKPLQMLALCVLTGMLYYPGMLFLPEAIGARELYVPASQIIFLSAITIILTGASAFLYYTRYSLYLARRTADGLTENTYFPEDTGPAIIETERLRKLIRTEKMTGDRLRVSEISDPSADEVFLDKVRQVIEAHMGDSNFGVEWLAHEVALSPRQLQRRLKASSGLTAGHLIRAMRLQRSAQLLQRRAGNVSEVAYKVGFQDPDYFSKLFRQMFEVNPSEFAGVQA